MLYRNIKVIAHFRLILNCLDKVIVNFLRITVQYPYPFKTVYFTKFVKQPVERFFSVNINAVYTRLLRYKNQFLYSLRRKPFGLRYKLLHRNASVRAPDFRDYAVCTAFITAFGYLEVFITAVLLTPAQFIRYIGYPVIRGSSDNRVNLGNLVHYFILISLRQTAARNKNLKLSGFFELRHLKQRINAFLLCVVYKAACIYDDYFGFVLIIRKIISPAVKQPKHGLRIGCILVTSK